MQPEDVRGALERCARQFVPGWLPAGSEPPPAILVSYATNLPPEWKLGLTAALFNVPIVLVGLGQGWNGVQSRLLGTRHAIELLRTHLGLHTTPVLVADAWDTMFVNRPLPQTTTLMGTDAAQNKGVAYTSRNALERLADGTSALLMTECNSWPRCYREAYMFNPTLGRCLNSSAGLGLVGGAGTTCYVNGGVYGGVSSVLSRLLNAIENVLADRTVRIAEVEKGDDQFALHQLLLATRHATRTTPVPTAPRRTPRFASVRGLNSDSRSELFLSLYPCSGDKIHRMLPLWRRAEYCHEADHEPIDFLVVNGSRTRYRTSRGETRPLIVHANGAEWRGKRLEHSVFSSLHSLFRPPPAALLEVRVLLVGTGSNSSHHLASPCNVTTLSALAAEARADESICRASKSCSTKMTG